MMSAADKGGGEAADSSCSILAFDDLIISQYVSSVTSAAEKIGGQVLEISKIIEEAFNLHKDLLVKINQTTQKPADAAEELVVFLKPLNEVIRKACALTTEGSSDFSHHLKAGADSLRALEWIAYTGKDCGMSMPVAHIEESWEMAEFYNDKILVEYRTKDANHVGWAKALKKLYLPGLRDYVKSNYPLGPEWSAPGKAALVSVPIKASSSPRVPPPPPAPPAMVQKFDPLRAKFINYISHRSKMSQSHPSELLSVLRACTSLSDVEGLRILAAYKKKQNHADRIKVVHLLQYVSSVTSAAEKIGGQVLNISKIIEEAFNVHNELLVKIKQTQKPADAAGLAEFLKPLNEVIRKASALIEGCPSDIYHHLKAGADSLRALEWIAYRAKDHGMTRKHVEHIEKSWRMAYLYNYKFLKESKDVNHVDWAKALQNLYACGLSRFVSVNYPMGPIWSGERASDYPLAYQILYEHMFDPI